ncbi:MAG: hypothetical protein EPO23_05125 [Xanthobacteraceae bacterium]|nr:MAG: hypothetical protein EPO23_05125 [Xanthobacteraceae bacterium]
MVADTLVFGFTFFQFTVSSFVRPAAMARETGEGRCFAGWIFPARVTGWSDKAEPIRLRS